MSKVAQVILASASPRRRQLLEQIGIDAIVESVEIDESRKPGESAHDYVRRLAMEKANRGYQVIDNTLGLPVIGSDTIVEIDGTILGKPADSEQAKTMLRSLSGKKHAVHTSVAIVTADKSFIDTSSTEVEFRELTDEEIDRYIETGEADDKAGAYAIQGIAAQFIKNINGSFSGVMGLPIYETVRLLNRCGTRPL